MSGGLSVVMCRIVELAAVRGVERVDVLPGCWACAVDESWSFKLNGHPEDVDGIPPFHAAVDHKGFPVGIVGPFGGLLMWGAEPDFTAALEAAIVRGGGVPS